MPGHAALLLLACGLATVIAALIGTAGSYLARRDGATYPVAIAAGAMASATTLTVGAAVTTALTTLSC